MATRTLRLVEDTADDAAGAGNLERGPVQGGLMKVAFATTDMKTVDAHFAGARTFAVYEVAETESRFLQAYQFDNASGQEGKHGDDGEERINARIRALEGCSLLFVKAIGGPAAAKVVRHNVHPVKLPRPEPIAEVIERVQTMMKAPPPWLRKVMMQNKAGGAEERDMAFLDDDDE